MKPMHDDGKKAIKCVTPSGVVAVVAADACPELLAALKRKLERKLRRSGHLEQRGQAAK